MNKYIQYISAVMFSFFSFILGEPDGLMYALITFMAMDYITGIILAVADKRLSSKIGFKGIAKKIFILVLVAVGNIIDTQVLSDGSACRSAVIGFYIANEGISILENVGNIGLPLPNKLKSILSQLKNKGD